MQIILLRHGRPEPPHNDRLNARSISHWVSLYNMAGLAAGDEPPVQALEMANQCRSVICSDLPRSIESAGALGFSGDTHGDPLFREAELPGLNFPSPRLPPGVWVVTARILWFLGYCPNCESLDDARQRARSCAVRLAEAAADEGPLLFVGHGILNKMIGHNLLSAGWSGPRQPGHRYWEFGKYELPGK
ncbi:MAG: histidine phosphatase family protein [Thermodesulfobacteriota bacterium]